MKLVIRIGDTDLNAPSLFPEIAGSVLQLLEEKHQAVVVHGASHEPHHAAPAHDVHGAGQSHAGGDTERSETECIAISKVNKAIVSRLAALGVAAFGLSGADGNLIRTRRKTFSREQPATQFEVAAVNPSWLDIIVRNGGVPVLSNMALGPDCKYCLIEADQLAAACSVAWKADALIFLTHEEGITNQDGNVIRWFDAAQLADPLCISTLPRNLLSQLNAGSYALKHGVKRARLLPISHSKSLASFYYTKIDFGTEVVVAS